jgi:hypothetical protein
MKKIEIILLFVLTTVVCSLHFSLLMKELDIEQEMISIQERMSAFDGFINSYMESKEYDN